MNLKERKAVLDYDAKCVRNYLTQFYAYLQPMKNGEIRVTTYAVKVTKRYGRNIVPVNVAWSNKDTYRCMNIWRTCCSFCGPSICFDEDRCQKPEGLRYNGKWSKPIKFAKDASWYIDNPFYVRVVNIEALQESKYKYCQFGEYWGGFGRLSIVRYLHLYNQHKEIEFLVKAGGLNNFINKRFLDLCRKDRNLFNYFRQHIAEVKAGGQQIVPNDVIRAAKHGWTVEYAHRANQSSVRFRRCELPKSVDKLELWNWMDKNKVDIESYVRYCGYIRRAGMDIAAFGVTMPRNFANALEEAEALAYRNERRDAIRAKRKLNAAIAKVRDTLAKLHGLKDASGYVAAFPKSVGDLLDEGRAMRNCVGKMGYDEKIAKGESIILFLRKNGKPSVDVEIKTQGWRVIQCYAKCNSAPDEAARKFSQLITKKIQNIYRKAA